MTNPPPNACLPLVSETLCGPRMDEMTVSAEDAEAFRQWGREIQGWGDGTGFDRIPFTFNDA